MSVPSFQLRKAQALLDKIPQKSRALLAQINNISKNITITTEDGTSSTPHYDWSSKTGRAILKNHFPKDTIENIIRAEKLVSSHQSTRIKPMPNDIQFTSNQNGTIIFAENELFSWYFLAHSYVRDKKSQRDIYLPAGGYAKEEGFGSIPANPDLLAAARAFSRSIDQEIKRRDDQKTSEDLARKQQALTILASIPFEAQNELNTLNLKTQNHFRGINENGEGFVLFYSWTSDQGKLILEKYLNSEQISKIQSAYTTLNND